MGKPGKIAFPVILVLGAITGYITYTSFTAAIPDENRIDSPYYQPLSPASDGNEPGNTGGEGGGTSVSIVPGSSSLTTDAYQPNPVQVGVGDTVTWTNDDAQPHTVTSGEGATPDGTFDSSIMAPGATFEHTFTEAGEYPYFCLLHPNMVGTVSVSS